MPSSDAKVAWREFESFLRHSAESPDLFSTFLDELLTPEERRAVGLRWQIVKELSRGTAQRQIAEKLNVSLVTVNRGARLFTNPDGACSTILSMKPKITHLVGRKASWRKQRKAQKP